MRSVTSAEQSTAAPLAGVKILAIERMLAAPYATQILADLGAEVIKVEQPGHGDETRAVAPFVAGESHYFIAVNRAKKSITLDLKHRDVGDVLSRLVEQSDVVIENLRAGRLDTMGYGFEWMCKANPTIILCSISGFGADGTWSQRPAFDLIVQALTGLMSVNGEPESGPTKIALPLSDLAAGLWAAIGITAHLAGPREAPVHLDLSMYETTIALETYLTQMVLSTGQTPGLIGSHHHAVTPYGKYRAADGWIVIALQTGVFWRRFCSAVGREDLIYDARFRRTADRLANRTELEAAVAAIVKERTVEEWEQFFLTEDVPGAAINSVADALRAPIAVERGLIRTVTVGGVDVPTVGNPIRVVGEAAPEPVAVPQLGADTSGVLTAAGFSDAEIRGFEISGLIGKNKQGDST
jgi:crotonobetainyl-CoA:carnitine CoA-transferase CaiB-like acyl-CoA transferase